LFALSCYENKESRLAVLLVFDEVVVFSAFVHSHGLFQKWQEGSDPAACSDQDQVLPAPMRIKFFRSMKVSQGVGQGLLIWIFG